jgi:predicted  nucleic acid-binding Zn-ribbon protein
MIFFFKLSNFQTRIMEFKKTVRLNQEEQKLLESIAEKLAFKTENKVFKHLVSNFDSRTRKIEELESQVEKLEFEISKKEETLESVQEALKLISSFSNLKF